MNEDSNKSEVNQESLMIPVFSEWTQQQMQEAEKKLVELTNSTEPNKDIKNETLAKHQIVKMRQKNYASPDCGAKILASNPEAQSTSSVLTEKDEYLLSPCSDRIWFVVELCDSIQSQRVELANFELFSSPLKSVSISVSSRFPTREWTFAGQFDAKNERGVQVFELSSTLFGKFVRVDLTYTNTEHYCPLSFFRVFGTSEIEAFETDNEPSNEMSVIDDDEVFEIPVTIKDQPNKDNLLNRAGAAVMSIVQKVLSKNNGNGTKINEATFKFFHRDCMSLSHNTLCQCCSNDERLEVNHLISCKNWALSKLLENNSEIKNHLVNSVQCNDVLGFNLKSEHLGTNKSFISSILSSKYIAAMCNILATNQKALSLRIEDLSSVGSDLVSKKDETSLKNISKKALPEDPQCKPEIVYPTPNDAPTPNETPTNRSSNETLPATSQKEAEQQKKSLLSGEQLNIFNVIEQEKTNSTFTDSDKTPTQEAAKIPSEDSQEEKKVNEESRPEENVPDKPPQIILSEPIEIQETSEPKTVSPLQPEVKTEQVEVKTNGDVRYSNPPESVFLRLSNRIKTLEKNMTLSTQYLEELSRRYKQQIEELQQSFSKLHISFEDQKKRDREKRQYEEKIRLHETVSELHQKSEYLELILIVVSAFLAFQTILVIALFKRISYLRITFASHKLHLDPKDKEIVITKPSSPVLLNGTARMGRKRSKQRTRKISAPNILTQRSPTKSEFSHPSPVLSRTVSAPNKFNTSSSLDSNKENFEDMQAMLEENDDILIPGFEELKITDSVSLNSHDLDTASTASAVSSNEKHEKSNANRSFKFKRRLSSPFQLKKSSLKKSSSDRTNQTWTKKAMSESPPRLTEHSPEIQKSKSFQDDDTGSGKFKKSNSFKKLFKKLF